MMRTNYSMTLEPARTLMPNSLGVFVSPMKIPPSLCGIRVIREIRGQKNQPRITQISRKNHNESHLHSQWRAAGSWKLGGEHGECVLTTKNPRDEIGFGWAAA